MLWIVPLKVGKGLLNVANTILGPKTELLRGPAMLLIPKFIQRSTQVFALDVVPRPKSPTVRASVRNKVCPALSVRSTADAQIVCVSQSGMLTDHACPGKVRDMADMIPHLMSSIGTIPLAGGDVR